MKFLIVCATLLIIFIIHKKRKAKNSPVQSPTTNDRAFHTMQAHTNNTLLYDFEQKVKKALEDGVVNREEEAALKKLVEISPSLQKSEAYTKLIQSLVLRDIEEGREFDRVSADGLPILLGKSERLLWAYTGIEGYEQKTGSRYTAGYNGVGFKICKGVYYRIGASQGHSQPYEYQKNLGVGKFIITNKAIYFVGDNHVKVPIAKVMSFEPYSDGITIVKDGANPKPYTFVGFDPWFLINAMQMLAE